MGSTIEPIALRDDDPDGIYDMRGTFVETAFTAEQIEKAIEVEIRLGFRNALCAFLDNWQGQPNEQRNRLGESISVKNF